MWKTKVLLKCFKMKKSFIFAQSKKGRIEIQPEVYPISKSLLGTCESPSGLINYSANIIPAEYSPKDRSNT